MPYSKEWWLEHPEFAAERAAAAEGNDFHAHFPENDSLAKQLTWFTQEFLSMARNAKSQKQRGEWLKLAFSATLKTDGKGQSELDAYREFSQQRDSKPTNGHFEIPPDRSESS